MKDVNMFKMLEILNRKELCGLHEVIVGILMCSSIDKDKGIGCFGSRDEMDHIEDDLFDAARLPSSNDDEIAEVSYVIELSAERCMGQDGDDHFMGRLFQF